MVLAKVGSQLGQGGRGRVFEAKTSEGQVVALKVYWKNKKLYSREEQIAYEYLQELGHTPDYLPRYHGPISLTPDKRRYVIGPSSAVYHDGIAIEKIEGSHFDKGIEDLSDEEFKSLEEKLLAAISNLHNIVGICHRDIKGDNILLTGSRNPWLGGFVIIDLSDAIIRKSMPDDKMWQKACREDEMAVRRLFKNAKSAKAVVAGCQLIHNTISILPSNTTDIEMSKYFNENLQMKLFKLLISARSGYTITLPTLIDQILSAIKHPIPRLALSLVRALCSLGQNDNALHIVEDCISAGLAESDPTLIPSFEYQMALLLKSPDSKPLVLQYFNSALSGFERQLGPDHITTQYCRYDLAKHHSRCGNIRTAKAMLVGLAEVIGGKTQRTNKEKRLLQQIQWDLKSYKFRRIFLEENENAPLVEVAISGTEEKPNLSRSSPGAV